MTETRTLPVSPLTAAAFAPFGVVIEPKPDGAPFSAEESVLDVSGGTPRFYIMSLEDKPATFTGITRHRRTTQTLLGVGGGEWLLAVAPPTADDTPPAIDEIRAFRIPGGSAVTLRKGTWHSGPFFAAPTMDFANLELSDTNVVDHDTYRLDRELGLRFALDVD